jgi:hypothetical protein
MKLLTCALALGLFAGPAFSADAGKKLFRWSLLTMWVSTSADVATSLTLDGRPNFRETNPLIGRQFGTKGIALEFGSRGIITAVELLIVRRHKSVAPYLGVGNFGLTGASSIAAGSNYRLIAK